jgi:hypothetical protein
MFEVLKCIIVKPRPGCSVWFAMVNPLRFFALKLLLLSSIVGDSIFVVELRIDFVSAITACVKHIPNKKEKKVFVRIDIEGVFTILILGIQFG